MFALIKKKIVFLTTLTAIVVIAFSHTKCISWSNQKCQIQLTLINLHTNKYSQILHCYSFTVKLDRCVGSC